MIHLRIWRPRLFTGLSALVMGMVSLIPVRLRADVSGHWNFEYGVGGTGLTDIAEVGGAVSFTITNEFGGSSSFSGTRTGNMLTVTSPVPGDCTLEITGTISPGDNAISGNLHTVAPCSFPGAAPISFQRCGCLDGNSDDGDGCDALCRVETCYSCSGEPSVCTPDADGTPCDDLGACTTGETCTSTVCGGGSPISPCIDMSGSWFLQYDFDYEGVPNSDGHIVFTQHNTILDTGSMRGTIDPQTGAFSLSEVVSSNGPFGFCPGNMLNGQVAADGRTLTGFFVTYGAGGIMCPGFGAIATGSRCGGGTLDAGEVCDDGNWTVGDGCDAACAVEQCYSCDSSAPSLCTPVTDGTGCDDGNGCTLDDACQAGACSGDAVECAPCLTCTGAAQCVAAPRTGCLRSTVPSQSTLLLRDRSVSDRDAVIWQWRRGEETTPAALGTPTQSTAYDLCIYDESTATPTLLFRGSAPAGVCPSAGCWAPRSRGFTYRSDSGAADGLTRIDLRAHSDGRSKVRVKGQGPFLTHAFGIPTAPLALPLRVQLQAVDSGLTTCFEAEYGAPGIRANDDGVFRAGATGP